MFSPFSIPRTRNFANWRFLYAQQINDTKNLPFRPNVITHKNDEECLFRTIKMKMKLTAFSAQSNCQDTISSFITFITATRWNVKNVRIADRGMFSSVTWLRLSACSRRAEALGLDQPFKNTISEKCNEGFSLSRRWTGSAAQRSKIKVTASSWSSCWWMQNHSQEFVLTNYMLKLQDGLWWNFILQVHVSLQSEISQKHIKGISHQLKDDLDQSWTSQHERPLTLHIVKISIYRLTADRQTALDNCWSNLAQNLNSNTKHQATFSQPVLCCFNTIWSSVLHREPFIQIKCFYNCQICIIKSF